MTRTNITITVLGILAIIFLGCSITQFIRSSKLAKQQHPFTIHLLDQPVDLTRPGTQDFPLIIAQNVPYHATVFFYLPRADYDWQENAKLHGTAKIWDSTGKIIAQTNLQRTDAAYGFPADPHIGKNGTLYAMISFPADMGKYRLQLTLERGIPEAAAQHIMLKACYMTSMPLFLESGIRYGAGIISLSIAIIAVMAILVLIFRQRLKSALYQLKCGMAGHRPGQS